VILLTIKKGFKLPLALTGALLKVTRVELFTVSLTAFTSRALHSFAPRR